MSAGSSTRADGPVGFGQIGRRRRARQATATTAGPRRSRDGPNPRHSCRSSHRTRTSGDRRVACDRCAEADQADPDAPLTALCQRHCPRSDLCFGISAEGKMSSRRDVSTARNDGDSLRGPSPGTSGSLGDHDSVLDQKRKNHDPGHWYRAQGCERGVRVRLVSFHAPVTGRLAVSRGRLGARGAAARRETLTGESPCVSRRS